MKRLPRGKKKTKKNHHCCGEKNKMKEGVTEKIDKNQRRRKKERARGKKESHKNCIYIYLQHNTLRGSCVNTCLLRIGFAPCSKKP